MQHNAPTLQTELLNEIAEICNNHLVAFIRDIENLYETAHPLKSKAMSFFAPQKLPYHDCLIKYKKIQSTSPFQGDESLEKFEILIQLLRTEIKDTDFNKLNTNLNKYHYLRMIAYALQSVICLWHQLAIVKNCHGSLPYLFPLPLVIQPGAHDIYQHINNIMYRVNLECDHTALFFNAIATGNWQHIKRASQFPGINYGQTRDNVTMLMALDWNKARLSPDFVILKQLISADLGLTPPENKKYILVYLLNKMNEQLLIGPSSNSLPNSIPKLALFLMLEGFPISEDLRADVISIGYGPLTLAYEKLITLNNEERKIVLENFQNHYLNTSDFSPNAEVLNEILSAKEKKSFANFFIYMTLLNKKKVNSKNLNLMFPVPKPILFKIGGFLPQGKLEDYQWPRLFTKSNESEFENDIKHIATFKN